MQHSNPSTTKYYDKLVLRKLMGITSPEEDSVLEAWLKQDHRNRESFEELRNRWRAERQIIPDEDLPRRSGTRKVSQKSANRKSKSFYVFEGLAFASLVAAAVLIFMGLKERPSIYPAGREIRTLVLSDSSTVTLRPGSVLLVASKYGDESRAVEVEGQALVEVRPDSLKPFTLITDHSRIEVTGTSFMADIPKDGEHEELVVLSGQLSMAALSNPEKPVVVTAGKKARFDHRAGTITLSNADTVNVRAWKEKKLIFDNAPLSQVIEVIEDYFGLPVHVENSEMLKCPFTRTFTEPRIEDVMKALREGLDVIVMREYGRIVIDGRNSCP